MEDAFADDSILIVLKNEASLKYLETEQVEFAEIEYKEVRMRIHSEQELEM